MKLYCYSEVSEQVEESEAVELEPNRGPMLVSGPNAHRVELHGTIEEAKDNYLLIDWDETPSGALEKYIKKQTEKAQKHMSNAMYAESLKQEMGM